MIERYSLAPMKEIWTEEAKLENWLKIEVVACEAMAELGLVPEDAVEDIKANAAFDVDRVKEIEQRTRHDVVAFLENVSEHIGESARYLHYGMTSSDVLDTGLALQMRDAVDILVVDTSHLLALLKKRALEFRDTIMIGRTHGVHAEPITFGHKLTVWAFETRRNLDRLLRARDTVSYGKISGAVGTYANLDPFVEKYVCDHLGLKPAEASTQILQRDRHAELMCTMAICASSLDKFATEVRALQKTEVMEAEEPFREGQTGSSAMPHKRNPIICERVCGLARVIRGNASVALQDLALWHERDISHSSAERVIIPDSTILLDYITHKFIEVLEGLVVYPLKMEEDMAITQGLIFSEKLLLALVNKGVTRLYAYKMVQANAMRAVKEDGSFYENLVSDPDVTDVLTPTEIADCFDARKALTRVRAVFERLEELKVEP
jgi:adenylosuccinate lyase